MQTITAVVVAAAAIAAWAGLYGLLRLLTRPAAVDEAPATPDLPEHPPALVNLLANRWRTNEDAAEATLLDLAARGFYEIRQPDDDPAHSTIHLREQERPQTLLPYEQRVLDRVRQAAVAGVVPLHALTFRDAKQAKGWRRRFRAEVVAHARRLDLSRRRFSKPQVTLLGVTAIVPSFGIALAVGASAANSGTERGEGGWGAIPWATIVSMCVFVGLAGAYPGERDTAAGRLAAARLLGVRRWLVNHESFADLPPASVAVWDRYLGYGAALGVTHVASAAIDLGMGSRRLVWSSYGGEWHRVRVRYPHLWRRYGQSTGDLVWSGLRRMGVGAVLLAFAVWVASWPGRRMPEEILLDVVVPKSVFLGALWLGAALAAIGLHRLVRAVIDHLGPREIVGEALWLQVWRREPGGENEPPKPWLWYLAVDDGEHDPTTAWGVPRPLSGRCKPGDVVRMKVHPWSRTVVALEVTRSSHGYGLQGHDTELKTDDLVSAALGGGATGGPRSSASPTALLTTDEVAAAVGQPVVARDLGPVIGLYSATQGGPVLMVRLFTGAMATRQWAAGPRGAPLPGVGDEAYADADGGSVRRGDNVVLLTLHRAGRVGAPQLPWLLSRAVDRLPAGVSP